MTDPSNKPLPAGAAFAEVYCTLKHIARRQRQRLPSKMLDTTAVVHEAWLKLNAAGAFANEHHYLSTAALAMRQILTDYARQRLIRRKAIESAAMAAEAGQELLLRSGSLNGADEVDLLAIDDALTRLEAIDPALVELISLRFYAGMTLAEVAEHRQMTVRTASRHWQRARAILRVLLDED